MAVISHKSVISPILVGRKKELSVLQGMLTQSRQGQGQLALLVGEAGIGKSRLAAEIRRQAEADGFWTLQGRCAEPDRLMPYAPLLEILRHHLDDSATHDMPTQLGMAADIIAKMFPELEWPIGVAASPQAPDQEKRLLHHGLTQYLSALAEQRPLLLIIEDLHWCDEATLDFLNHVVRTVVDQPILLLFSYRGNEIRAELSAFLATIGRQRVAVEVVLMPLTIQQIDEMMRAIFDLTRPVRGDFLRAVTDLTEGNPFFIEEVLKALLAVGDIFYAEHAWDRRPLGELRLPRTVTDAVQHRAGNLSAVAHQLLVLAAVAGRRFDVAILQVVTKQDDATLLGVLKELVAAQFIVEEGVDEFAFRHALTQHALYSNLLGRERKAMHLALAQAIADRQSGHLDAFVPELAYHYHAAGAWAEALVYTRRAGDQAQARYSSKAAVRQYSRALEAASHLPDSSITATELAALFRARGLAYDMVGDFDQALEDLQQALATVRAHEQEHPNTQATEQAELQLEWQLLIDLGFLWASRDYARTGDYYQEALKLAQRIEEPNVLAHTYNRVGNWQLNRGDCRAAIAAYQQALVIFEAGQDRAGLAQTYDLLGMATGHLGDPVSFDYYLQAATIFRELDDRVGLISALAILGPCRMFFSKPEERAANIAQSAIEFAETVELAQQLGLQAAESFVLSEYAQGLVWRGDYADALAHAQRSLVLAEEIEHRQWLGAALATLGSIHWDLMDYPQARKLLEQALVLAEEMGSFIFLQFTVSLLIFTLLEQGEGDLAMDLSARITFDTPVSYHDHFCWLARMRLALWRDEPEEVLQLFAKCQPNFTNESYQYWLTIGLRQAQVEALVALDDPQAESMLCYVCETAQQNDVRPLLWRARIDLGNYLLGQQRREDAAHEFAFARATIEELATGIEDEALCAIFRDHALGMIPTHAAPTLRQAAKRTFDGLTATERQVAALVAQGMSNREIADARVVSIKTVEAHISHILSKLDFTSRTQIAVWAVEKGLAAPSSTAKNDAA